MDARQQQRLIDGLTADYASVELSCADRVMLDYAVKLTKNPARVTCGDIESLRKEGFDDRAVHDICAIAAYFAFVNRMADGLGVELEESHDS